MLKPVIEGKIFVSGGENRPNPKKLFEVEQYLNSIVCSEVYGKFGVGVRVHLSEKEDESDMTLHQMKEPIRSFLIKGARPELKGLEVAFDSEGYCGLRCVANPKLAFILTKETSLVLADLIELQQNPIEQQFALAVQELEEDRNEG